MLRQPVDGRNGSLVLSYVNVGPMALMLVKLGVFAWGLTFVTRVP